MLSDRQVKAVVNEVNESINLPFIREQREAVIIEKYVNKLNPHLCPALDYVCGNACTQSIQIALDENRTLLERRENITTLLRGELTEPLSIWLNEKIDVCLLNEQTEEKVLRIVIDHIIKKFVEWTIGDWIDDAIQKSSKQYFYSTENYGSDEGGVEFNDGRDNGKIQSITVNSGSLVDSIKVMYSEGNKEVQHGGDGGGSNTLELDNDNDEYITEIVVRANDERVVCLTFKTNKGQTLGPCGGDGGFMGIGGGKEHVVRAPDETVLVGIKGRSGEMLDAIGFHFASIPKKEVFCED